MKQLGKIFILRRPWSLGRNNYVLSQGGRADKSKSCRRLIVKIFIGLEKLASVQLSSI